MINPLVKLALFSEYDENIRLSFDYLLKNQNADGGWGYKAGGQSFTEPTALALLALFHPKGAGKLTAPLTYIEAVQKGLLRLREDQNEDGGWGVFSGDTFSNWMTYPALWTLNVMLKTPELTNLYGKPEDLDSRNLGREWILNRGREPEYSDKDVQEIKTLFRIDATKLGWKWGLNPGEAAFVIPTSLAIIALTVEDRSRVSDTDQILMGKAYLRDRSCADGGWNVGNPYIYDKALPASPDGTAYSLLAFACSLGKSDFGATQVIWRGVSVLADFVENTRSPLITVLGVLALRFFPDINGNTQERLSRFFSKLVNGETANRENPSKGQGKNGSWADSPFITALAVLALSSEIYFF